MLKRATLIVFMFCILSAFCACRHKTTYPIKSAEVDAIHIVSVQIGEDGVFDKNIVAEIADISSFLRDLSKVGCYTYFGDPTGLFGDETSGKVIQILYENGDYELINWKGQSRYTENRGFVYYAGYYVFDQQAFEELIQHYSS